MYVCAKYLLPQSLCPVVQGSFLRHLYHWRVFIYSLVTCVCSLPLPSQVKALGVGGLGLWVLSTSVELRGTQLTLMMSTFSVLFHVYSLLWCSQEPSFGLVLPLTSIIHAHADFLSSVGECEWFCKRDWVDEIANLCIEWLYSLCSDFCFCFVLFQLVLMSQFCVLFFWFF